MNILLFSLVFSFFFEKLFLFGKLRVFKRSSTLDFCHFVRKLYFLWFQYTFILVKYLYNYFSIINNILICENIHTCVVMPHKPNFIFGPTIYVLLVSYLANCISASRSKITVTWNMLKAMWLSLFAVKGALLSCTPLVQPV